MESSKIIKVFSIIKWYYFIFIFIFIILFTPYILFLLLFDAYCVTENASSLPPLSPQMSTKLRQLTIVSLSADHKVTWNWLNVLLTWGQVIPYTVLLQQLDIPNVRELEDLIIDCIYQGVIRGKLDQKFKQLEVDFAIGRGTVNPRVVSAN